MDLALLRCIFGSHSNCVCRVVLVYEGESEEDVYSLAKCSYEAFRHSCYLANMSFKGFLLPNFSLSLEKNSTTIGATSSQTIHPRGNHLPFRNADSLGS
jgi:hypothetical protein